MLLQSETLKLIIVALASVIISALLVAELCVIHLEMYLVRLLKRSKPMALDATSQAIVDAVIAEVKAEVAANASAAEAILVAKGDAAVNAAEARILAILPKNGLLAEFVTNYATNLIKNAAAAAVAAMPKNAETLVSLVESELNSVSL